jgi:hypothetical protein
MVRGRKVLEQIEEKRVFIVEGDGRCDDALVELEELLWRVRWVNSTP